MGEREGVREGVCMCVCEREREGRLVCIATRAIPAPNCRARERVCVYVRESVCERESVC